jgi:hypothetical protein
MTDLEKFLVLLLDIKDHAKWSIWDYRACGGWKQSGDMLSYYLVPDFQIMSTIEKEPVFTGEFLSEDGLGTRHEIGDLVFFADRTENILIVLNKKDEITGKAWWLRREHRFSQDWSKAEWMEI